MTRQSVSVYLRRRGRALVKFIVGLVVVCSVVLALALVLFLDRTF